MSAFGDYLEELIKKRNISVSKLSKDSGVERTAIHKAINGKRILPYPAIEQLILSLQLSPQESRKLRQYYDLLFEGESIYRVRLMINEMFSQLSDIALFQGESQWKAVMEKKGLWGPVNLSERSLLNGSACIAGFLREMFAEELKQPKARILIAVPPNVKAVNDSILRLCQCGRKVGVSHIVGLDVSCEKKEHSLNNLESLTSVLPACILSEGKYQVSYYYKGDTRMSYTDPLPYFLVTHVGAVCFSEDCKTAIYFKEQERIEYFDACFHQMEASCHRLLEYEQDPRQALRKSIKSGVEEEPYLLMSQPYFPSSPAEKVYSFFARKGLTQMMEIRRPRGNAAGNVGGVDSGEESTIEGALEDGREGARGDEKDGRKETIGGALGDGREGTRGDEIDGRKGTIGSARGSGGSEKREFLQRMMEEISAGGKSRILNERVFTLPDNLGMLASGKKDVFFFEANGKWGFWIREADLNAMFYEWITYLPESGNVFSQEKTLEILKETEESIAG